MKFFSILLVAVSLVGVSCERHEFEETKKLHEHHGAAAHDEHAAGAHESHDSHAAKPAEHAEKKEH